MIKVLFIEDNDDHVYMLKYPGGSSGCVSIAPPLTRPSPNGRRVGIRIVTLGSLTLRPVGLLSRLKRRCHEASALPVAQPSRSSASSSPSDPRLRGALPNSGRSLSRVLLQSTRAARHITGQPYRTLCSVCS
jgi:hypothetical protein